MNGTKSRKAMLGWAANGTGVPIPERFIDCCLGAAFLGAALPVFVAAALAVKLSGSGPMLQTLDRVGPLGHTFREYRFNCFGAAGVTPVGRVLIMSRIDSIPNILNVIKGDMSFLADGALRPFTA